MSSLFSSFIQKYRWAFIVIGLVLPTIISTIAIAYAKKVSQSASTIAINAPIDKVLLINLIEC